MKFKECLFYIQYLCKTFCICNSVVFYILPKNGNMYETFQKLYLNVNDEIVSVNTEKLPYKTKSVWGQG